MEEEDDGKINPEKAKKWVSGKTEWSYSHKDVILYNLGVGSGPAKDTCELRYIYENHEDFMVSLNLKNAIIYFSLKFLYPNTVRMDKVNNQKMFKKVLISLDDFL